MGAISINTLDADKDTYAGETLKIEGKIAIIPEYSREACYTQDPCDTIISVDLYLSDGDMIKIPIYKNGKKYPCTHAGETLSCPPYSNGETKVITATFVKTQQPAMTVTSSSGQTQVLKWKDFYYLEVK